MLVRVAAWELGSFRGQWFRPVAWGPGPFLGPVVRVEPMVSSPSAADASEDVIVLVSGDGQRGFWLARDAVVVVVVSNDVGDDDEPDVGVVVDERFTEVREDRVERRLVEVLNYQAALNDEVERLRAQVAELLPWAREAAEAVERIELCTPGFLVTDIERPSSPETAATRGEWVAYRITCEDAATELAFDLLDRIAAGEFGPLPEVA